MLKELSLTNPRDLVLVPPLPTLTISIDATCNNYVDNVGFQGYLDTLVAGGTQVFDPGSCPELRELSFVEKLKVRFILSSLSLIYN